MLLKQELNLGGNSVKSLKKVLSVFLSIALVFTMTFSMPEISRADSGAVLHTDSTIVCNSDPAGMKTIVRDTGDGFVTISLALHGVLNINSFSWAVKYNKSNVVPVTVAQPISDAPNSRLTTSTEIAKYFHVTATTTLVGWPISSYQIENTTSAPSGNYFLIGYAKSTGKTISLSGISSVNMINIKFRKISNVDTDTFSYFYTTVEGTVVNKMVYSTTNIIQSGTSAGTAYCRPDLFTLDLSGLTNPESTATPATTLTPVPNSTPTPVPPTAPTINTITNTSKTISGKAVSGGIVSLTIGTKKYTASAVSGAWKVFISKTLAAGTKVSAIVKMNNVYSKAKSTYVIPATPTVNTLKANSIYVKGTATKGSLVYAKIGSKNYSAKASSKTGTYSIKIPKINKGTSVSVKCMAGGRMSATKTVMVS